MTRSVGIVVPAYRPDVERLRTYVTDLDERLEPAAIRIELDDPREGVPEALADLPVTVHAVPYRRGKGAAITAGFEALGTDVLSFADADGSTPADAFGTIVEPVRDGGADLAVGSRRHPDASVQSHQTLARRFLGDGFAWLAGQLLDEALYDYQCGAKAIDRDAWELVREHLYDPGFAWDVELVAMTAALELHIEEVPIEWHDQPGSTVSPIRTSLRLARSLVSARHRAKQLRDSRLHTAIASRREEPTALVEKDE